MFIKSLIVIACLVAVAYANPIIYQLNKDLDLGLINHEEIPESWVRDVRSPGSVDLSYRDDSFGRRAQVDYNQNLYSNGGFSLDAYGRGSRNFDHNQNDFGGGLSASYSF